MDEFRLEHLAILVGMAGTILPMLVAVYRQFKHVRAGLEYSAEMTRQNKEEMTILSKSVDEHHSKASEESLRLARLEGQTNAILEMLKKNGIYN